MLKTVLFTLPRANSQINIIRHAQKRYPKIDKKLQAAAESLAARGFLRPNKPWEPPANINETILKICSDHGLNLDSYFESLEVKFKVLKACFEETGHGIPNSLLHTIECVETIGPWGPRAVKFPKELYPRLVVAAGDKGAGSFLAQRLSIAIQRGNAVSVLGTIPRGAGLFDNLNF